MAQSPILIAVAPNGARKSKGDHAALPIAPLELAKAAADCAAAGASMIHLHVRDAAGNHSLEPELYRAAIFEVKAAVGEEMLIQVSSEAAGIYFAEQQIRLAEELAPHCLSCGLREFITDESSLEKASHFFNGLHKSGTLIQYILYSPAEVRWFEELCHQGIIPGKNHFLLFVLGNYHDMASSSVTLKNYVKEMKKKRNWMACAFGKEEQRVMQTAAQLGGHVRIGFENNMILPSGKIAADNAELVEVTAQSALFVGRTYGNKRFAESLFFLP